MSARAWLEPASADASSLFRVRTRTGACVGVIADRNQTPYRDALELLNAPNARWVGRPGDDLTWADDGRFDALDPKFVYAPSPKAAMHVLVDRAPLTDL